MSHLNKKQALNGSQPGELCVMATGGGAYKFYDKIRDVLGVDVIREDEMECLIIGELPVCRSSSCTIWMERGLIHKPRPRLLHHRDPPRSLHL